MSSDPADGAIDDDPGRPWPSLRPPRTVWLLTGLMGALLVLHSLLSPYGQSPDETTHADLVFHIADGGSYPEHDGRMVGDAIMRASWSFRPLLERHTPDNVRRQWFRDTFDEFGGDLPTRPYLVNQMPQHPPLYYELIGGGLEAERAAWPGDLALAREWRLARTLSSALVLPLPMLAWLVARTLGSPTSIGVAAAAVPLAVPQLFHIGASVNNGSLLTLIGGVLTFLLARVLRGDLGRWLPWAIGGALGFGLLTKAFALLFPFWILVVFVARVHRCRAETRRRLVRLAVVAGSSLVVGGWWWVSNLIRQGQLAPTTEDELYTTAMRTPGFEPDRVWFAVRFLAWMPRRFLGWFGWLDVPLSLWSVVAACAIGSLAFVAAMWRPAPGDGSSRPARADLLLLASLVPMLLGFVALRAYDLYATTSRTPFIQGRYLFSAMVPISVLVAVGMVRLLRGWAPAVVLVGAVVLHVDAATVMLRGWWAEPDASLARSYHAMMAWNPLPLGAQRAVVPLLLAGLLATGLSMLSVRRGDRASTPAPAGPVADG